MSADVHVIPACHGFAASTDFPLFVVHRHRHTDAHILLPAQHLTRGTYGPNPEVRYPRYTGCAKEKSRHPRNRLFKIRNRKFQLRKTSYSSNYDGLDEDDGLLPDYSRSVSVISFEVGTFKFHKRAPQFKIELKIYRLIKVLVVGIIDFAHFLCYLTVPSEV